MAFMTNAPKRVVITGGAGQIAYSLLFRIANGDLYGPHQSVSLHLLDVPESEMALKGVEMELNDCVFPLLKGIHTGSDPKAIFEGADAVFLVGAKPRGPGMERKDLLADNGKIFVGQGKALNEVASRSARTLVVGNPCNTNCLIAAHHAPKLSPRQFFAMTRLDHNRAIFQLADKAGVSIGDVTKVSIWGNHSNTQVPDFHNAIIKGKRAPDAIGDLEWLEKVFVPRIQKRGAEVIQARGKSSAASAANAALDAMRSILVPTPANDWFSMGVYSKGNPYQIDEGLYFSFPCRSKGNGDAEIVSGVEIDRFLKEKIAITERELIEERELVAHLLG